MIQPVRFRSLGSVAVPAFDELVRIYEGSIPASERKTVAAIREMGSRPDYRLMTATTVDDRVIGFAAVFAPPGESFALLEYLAVDAAARGKGVGAGLFRATVDALAQSLGGGRWMFLEVEAEGGPDGERVRRERRQAFYRRLGCRNIAGLAYELPLRTKGKPPPAMNLFVHSVPAGNALRRGDLIHALRLIYQRVYGQSETDPRIDRMMDGVADPVSLE